ncbi:hypothetical protein AW736_04945 [Termitidicoccus mucosus]|uniref:DUF6036 domain-containing protein n=1 Tax=Termitidicoccus mucosus TaxID=1184151 RepID=A0A178IML0_9BACT|nr:hypothetical protein AW736_04945 [Opitutaceae bacterium TSB47]
MNPAQVIADTLHRHLQERTELVVFGAAALLLDHRFAERMVGRLTHDIDIIVPETRELQVNTDRQFWHALEVTNRELERKKLYITHIFPENEVTLTPEWKQHTVALLNPQWPKLNLIRPHVLDLIVSKMGRGDVEDQADVRSMLRLHRDVEGQTITAAEVAAAAQRARVPEVYRELFPRASAQIIAAVREAEITIRSGPRMGL